MVARRRFIKTYAAGLVTAYVMGCSEKRSGLPPFRALTCGPKFHWFGYYDKFQFDPTDRYVLCMEVDFEHRSPTENDLIKVGMIDLQKKDRWFELGESHALNWQQGCML